MAQCGMIKRSRGEKEEPASSECMLRVRLPNQTMKSLSSIT